jgi:sodium transport system ATP-binding protein
MIRVSRVHKSFGAVVAVDDVSFAAENGTVTALLGPNGAGKTTTLRMMTAVLAPDRGHVLVDGIDTARDARHARAKIGLLSDNRGLYARLTSRENIRYFAELHRVPPAKIDGRIDDLSRMLDMREIIDRRVDGFSLGQKLKVAVARALVHDPPNVLLDEPTAGLDVMTTRALRDVMMRLREAGKCVVLSTHVMQEVARLADRVVVVAKGHLCADATADELRRETGCDLLEDAFVKTIGTAEGVMS